MLRSLQKVFGMHFLFVLYSLSFVLSCSSSDISIHSLPSYSCCQYAHSSPLLLNQCLYATNNPRIRHTPSSSHQNSVDDVDAHDTNSYREPPHEYDFSHSFPKIAIVSYSTPNIVNYSSYSHGINVLYSQLHNYTFYMFNITNGQYDKTDERWNKIKILQHCLLHYDKFDYFIWIDADAVVLNYEFLFLSIIQQYSHANIISSAENFEILISNLFTSGGSVNKINSGVVILRNTHWSLSFLTSLWSHSNRTKYADQTVFDFVYNERSQSNHSDVTHNIVILPPHVINSNSPVSLWYQNYQPILHLLGEHPLYREYVLKQIFQSICFLDKRQSYLINNVILNITSTQLALWYLQQTYPLYQTMFTSLTTAIETINSLIQLTKNKTLSLEEINKQINEMHLSQLVGSIIHVSTRLAGALVFSPSSHSSSSPSSSSPQLLQLPSNDFISNFFQLSSPPPVSLNNGDALLLKTYRILRTLLTTLRPVNKAYFQSTSEQHNMTKWYYYLHMTSLLGEFVCSIPSYGEKSSLVRQVQDLYQELLSFPNPPVDSPVSTRSNQLRSLGLLQYYELLGMKRNQSPLSSSFSSSNGNIMRLELAMEGNFLEAYEIYRHLSLKYGPQGLWMMEGMLGIISCELNKFIQAELYFQKAMKTMSPLGETDFSLGIILKYYSQCLIKINKLNESEELLKQSLLIHQMNRIPLTHMTYQQLFEIKRTLQETRRGERGRVGVVGVEDRQLDE